MDRSEIVAQLGRLGLEDVEAEAYVELYSRGPSSAGSLAEELNVHKTKAYWVLEKLAKKGFARETASEPRRYEAVDPDSVVADRREEAEDRIAEIERIRDRIADPLGDIRRSRSRDLPEGSYRLVLGRDAVADLLETMIDEATGEIVVCSVSPWAHRSPVTYADAWHRAIERAHDGIGVRAIFHTTPEMRDEIDAADDVPSIEVRHMEARRRRPFVVVDGERALLWLVVDPDDDPSPDDVAAVWSSADPLVDDLRETFTTIWKEARPLDQLRSPDSGPSPAEPT